MENKYMTEKLIKDKCKSEELIQKIKDLRKLQDKKLEQLERSLAIQSICPDAFKYGSCSSYTKTKCTAFGDKFESFIITRGDGSKVIITDIEMLPPILQELSLTMRDKIDMRTKKIFAERRAKKLGLNKGE